MKFMENSENNNLLEDEMRLEYDESVLKNGVRGKYYQRHKADTNLALLASDVRKAFPTDEDVNRALRSLMGNFSNV